MTVYGFLHSSVGKESACNARDPGLIPGLGRSPGEGIGYPLQYSWASLVAQLVKNLPAVWETWVWSLGWEDPLENERLPLQYSGLENSMDCIVHGVAKSWTQLSNFHFHFYCIVCFCLKSSYLICSVDSLTLNIWATTLLLVPERKLSNIFSVRHITTTFFVPRETSGPWCLWAILNSKITTQKPWWLQ